MEQYQDPDWGPLERLTQHDPDVLGWFMWMHSVRLSDGRLLQAYKHEVTRQYLHLAVDLTNFRYVPPLGLRSDDDGRYDEWPLGEALGIVLAAKRLASVSDERATQAAERLVRRWT